MLTETDNIYNPSIREKFERGMVSKVIGTKAKFGMGIKNKLNFKATEITCQ